MIDSQELIKAMNDVFFLLKGKCYSTDNHTPFKIEFSMKEIKEGVFSISNPSVRYGSIDDA